MNFIHQLLVVFPLQEGIGELHHLGLKAIPGLHDFFANLSHGGLVVRNFTEGNAVRTLQFERLPDGFFFVVIKRKALPLGVDRVN